MESQPVVSAEAVDRFTPIGSPTTFLIAPLDYMTRSAFRGALLRAAGLQPSEENRLVTLRLAVEASGAGNAGELLAALDLAEAEPANVAAQRRVNQIETACSTIPAVSAFLVAKDFHDQMFAWWLARYALRGWEGGDLPAFERGPDGLVPEALLQAVANADLVQVGGRAGTLMALGQRAMGNSASPSPSPETPKPVKAVSGQKTGRAGSSAGSSTRPTRA